MTTVTELRNTLRSTDWCEDPFRILGKLADVYVTQPRAGRELVIRALENRARLDQSHKDILNDLIMSVGLYPYVENLESLSLRNALEHAAHRAESQLEDYVLHRSQSEVFEALLDGRSVILSAPTSYGKSLLIDAIIAAQQFTNVVVIVPTIALIEETRRRLMKFSPKYEIVTNAGQRLGELNIFVLTQERYLALSDDLPSPDFFVIDEFYKLSLGRQGDRSNLLNRVFMDLERSGAQFYLLGPSIQSIPENVLDRLDCDFLIEDFNTVALELHTLSKKPSKPKALAKALNDMHGQTLIYCQSPASARRVLAELLDLDVFSLADDDELNAAAEWTALNYHEEWLVSLALRYAVGIHHGRLPRALARFMVRAFEEGKLTVLFCTSTLIEGVNTSARNVVIYDNMIGRTKLDFFTFNNIRGRSGRMFKHFVGHVYVFDPPPEEELPFVDIPAFNPSGDTPTSLLIRMRSDELPPDARLRLDKVLSQSLVPREILEGHPSVEPELLIDAALALQKKNIRDLSEFGWSVRPTYEQVDACSSLIWDELGGEHAAKNAGILSPSMMTFWIWDLYKKRNLAIFRKSQIANQINRGKSPDDAVEVVLAFIRNWASFNYPRYLMALNDVSNCVLAKRGMAGCDYAPFATSIEHLFQPSSFAALEEYGLPVELSERLLNASIFSKEDQLGSVLGILRHTNLAQFGRDIFERNVYKDFQKGIGIENG